MSILSKKIVILWIPAGLALSIIGGILILDRPEVEPLPPDVELLFEAAKGYEGPYKFDRIVRASASVGRAVGMDLPRLAKVARRLPRKQRQNFYDGAMHGIPWPIGNLPDCYDAIDKSIPRRYRRFLYAGPILRLAQIHRGDPDRVMPLLQNLPARARPFIPNGLRIGVLLEFFPNWEEAIAVIIRYPQEYHATMFEELGWWMGDFLKTDLRKVNHFLARIPEDYQMKACRGYIRGLRLSGDRTAYESAIAALDPCYRQVAFEALDRKWQEDLNR